jgi:hypothetical protein
MVGRPKRTPSARARARPAMVLSRIISRSNLAKTPARYSSARPRSTVVWVNEHSHNYHFSGMKDYGHKKSGAYMCETEAQTSGNRAAMNERHP